jgi:hypothetical protein
MVVVVDFDIFIEYSVLQDVFLALNRLGCVGPDFIQSCKTATPDLTYGDRDKCSRMSWSPGMPQAFEVLSESFVVI